MESFAAVTLSEACNVTARPRPICCKTIFNLKQTICSYIVITLLHVENSQSLSLCAFLLIHDLLFLPISTIESRVS